MRFVQSTTYAHVRWVAFAKYHSLHLIQPERFLDDREKQTTRSVRLASSIGVLQHGIFATTRDIVLTQMSKEPTFKPSTYDVHSNNLEGYSQEDVARAREAVEREMAGKNKRLRDFEIAWTVISTTFAIISTSILLSKKWVEGVVSYVILGLLIAYVIGFIVMCAAIYRHPYSTSGFKVYSKALKIFKTLANMAFLVLTFMTMIAIVKENKTLNVAQWLIFFGNLIIAVVQLIIKIISLVRFLAMRHTAKNYSVKVMRYVDGEEQKKTRQDIRYEKKFK